MKRMLRLAMRVGMLCLLCLSASLAPGTRADTGPEMSSLPSPLSKPSWAVLGSLTRLLPIDTYTGKMGGTLTLAGGRDEIADAQVALFAAGAEWHVTRLRFSPLVGPGGAVVAASALRWRQIASVRTQKPNYQVRYVGLWPDPLLPASAFEVAAQGRAFVWADVRVPVHAKAGTYKGTLSVEASGGSVRPLSIPVSLRVWGYAMPRQSHVRTAFGIGFNGKHPLDTNLAATALLAHRLTPTNCVSAPRPLPAVPGQPPRWDWTEYDRAITHRLAEGMTGFALTFPNDTFTLAQAYQKHLSQKHWLRYAYIYVADEPEAAQVPALNQTLAQYKSAAPLIPLLVTARGYPAALTHVDIWCPAIVVERDDYYQSAASQQAQATGHASWWYPAYVSHAPAINLWTDYPLLDDRIWPWLTWKENVDGMLYWAVTNWENTADPLHDARTFLDANGDGELFYPGPNGTLLDSLRLEALRDGMQDYEVLCLLEAGARELAARKQAPALATQARALCAIDNGFVTNWKRFNTDPQALLATRARMSLALEQVVTQLGHTPAIVGRPRYRPALPL